MEFNSKLLPIATFGWKPDVVNNGILYDDSTILYVANKLLVMYNFITKTQVIADLNYSSYVTCICLSPNKLMIAAAQYQPHQSAFIEILSIPFGKKFLLHANMIDSNVLFFFIINFIFFFFFFFFFLFFCRK
jgi:hypothetical protein